MRRSTISAARCATSAIPISGVARRGSRICARAMNVSHFVSCRINTASCARHREGPAWQACLISAYCRSSRWRADSCGKYKRGEAPRRYALRQSPPADLRHPAQRGYRREAAGVCENAATPCWNSPSPGSLVSPAGVIAGATRRTGRAERQGDRLDIDHGRDRRDRRDYEVVEALLGSLLPVLHGERLGEGFIRKSEDGPGLSHPDRICGDPTSPRKRGEVGSDALLQ